jgi:regulator of CtrA degradation
MSTQPSDLNPQIIESLYGEALVLADEVRAAFDLSSRAGNDTLEESSVRMALSCEALRTTTRMMHAIAWLLNQRAYCKGELSETQLRRHGRLPRDNTKADPDNLMLLNAETRALIVTSERFHARIERLDHAWRERFDMKQPTVRDLRQRLSEAVRGF